MVSEKQKNMSNDPDNDGPFAHPLVCSNRTETFRWLDSAALSPGLNEIESWVHALKGTYKHGHSLRHDDLVTHDLVLLHLDYPLLSYFDELLSNAPERDCPIVGVFDGSLDRVHPYLHSWRRVADQCDIVLAVNGHGVDYLQSLTSTPVTHIGVPYPIEAMENLRKPVESRDRASLLCSWMLDRSTDYCAAQRIGLPMIGFERTYRKMIRSGLRGRKKERMRWVDRANELYNDDNLTIHADAGAQEFFDRARNTLVWFDLDPRFRWARSVLDGAALGIPVISTTNTWIGPTLFPDLVIDSPYDLTGAAKTGRRLVDDQSFYRDVVEKATERLQWFGFEATVGRLQSALVGDIGSGMEGEGRRTDFRQEWH